MRLPNLRQSPSYAHEASSNRGGLSATCKWGSLKTPSGSLPKKISAKARAARVNSVTSGR